MECSQSRLLSLSFSKTANVTLAACDRQHFALVAQRIQPNNSSSDSKEIAGYCVLRNDHKFSGIKAHFSSSNYDLGVLDSSQLTAIDQEQRPIAQLQDNTP